MIPRYSREAMARIWSPETRYRIWFEIEAHACDAQAELGVFLANARREVDRQLRDRVDVMRVDALDERERATEVHRLRASEAPE